MRPIGHKMLWRKRFLYIPQDLKALQEKGMNLKRNTRGSLETLSFLRRLIRCMQSLNHIWSPVELGSTAGGSMYPLHGALAAARLTSRLSTAARSCRDLSQVAKGGGFVYNVRFSSRSGNSGTTRWERYACNASYWLAKVQEN